MNISIKLVKTALAGLIISKGFSQSAESPQSKTWTNHFQLTVISQKHNAFYSKYSGLNSLADSVEPTAISITATLFLGRRMWKNGSFYLNPEVSGGNGLSYTKGIAGALNGETYRVGAVAPSIFIARAYLQQNIPLGPRQYESVEDDVNQVADKFPTSRLTISAGKFAMSDFYDDNKFSKDPRSQFFNWSLWANGAWDYPANTRGYTFGLVVELIKPEWAIRVSSVAVPRIANFHLMEYDITKAHSETFEFEHKLSVNNRPGKVRVLISNTHSKAPSYAVALNALDNNNVFLLNVVQGNIENNRYGGEKLGFGCNVEQQLTKEIGAFTRLGWNDGKYVSWAFTEIDRTASVGLSVKGNKWNRSNDVFGIANVVNGISNPHRNYLRRGGYGFIIGDGNLNYGKEEILETYYMAKISSFFWLTADYQFVSHPAYNRDRGPVHVFALRGHVQF